MASELNCSSVTDLDYIACECGIEFHNEKEFKDHLHHEHIKKEPEESVDDNEDFYVLKVEKPENGSASHMDDGFQPIAPSKNIAEPNISQPSLQEIKTKEPKLERYEVRTLNFNEWEFNTNLALTQNCEVLNEEPVLYGLPIIAHNLEISDVGVRLITIPADCGQEVETLNFVDAIASEIVLEDNNSTYNDDFKEKVEITSAAEIGDYGFQGSVLPAQYMSADKDQLRFCQLCSHVFVSERSFKMHYKRVHMEIETKSIKKYRRRPLDRMCEVCGRKFSSNALLSYHQRVHTGERPYKCTFCGKAFSMLLRLQIHVRRHTGEKPYKCQICPKAFPNKAALNRHDRVHTGEKPYPCPECGKAFSQSNSMKWHVRTVHWKEPWPYRKKKRNHDTNQ